MKLKKYLEEMKKGDGATLQNYKPVRYSKGYQVASTDNRVKTVEEAIQTVKGMNGSAGIWRDPNGDFCIDCSHYIENRGEAIKKGKEWNQKSIYDWKLGVCIYLEDNN